jgi:MoaA/NifB/PqqE/SkfB family radical SAM enzyme
MWPFDHHDFWRIYNAMRCGLSRNGAMPTAQPFFAELEPTTACNLHCRFCLNPSLPHPRHALSYEQFLHILDSLPGLLAISLLGLGEPTLNRDLFRMASEARRRKIYVVTVTNLNVPERTVHKLAESDFNEISISLESTDPGRYEWFRGGGSLARLDSNLSLLSDLRHRNARTFSVGLWTTVTEMTLESIENVFQFCAKSGAIERIQFQFVLDKPIHLAVYDEELRGQLIPSWKKTGKRLADLIWDCSQRYGILGYLIDARCGYPWSGVFINAQGLLAPCCHIKDYQNPPWGDIANGSLDRAWRSEDWVRLRKGILSGAHHSACRGCPYAYR